MLLSIKKSLSPTKNPHKIPRKLKNQLDSRPFHGDQLMWQPTYGRAWLWQPPQYLLELPKLVLRKNATLRDMCTQGRPPHPAIHAQGWKALEPSPAPQ